MSDPQPRGSLPPALSLGEVLDVAPPPTRASSSDEASRKPPEPTLDRVDPTRFHGRQRRSRMDARVDYADVSDELNRVAARTAGMARVLPLVIGAFVAIGSLLVITRLLGGGGATSSPHVELELLTAPGHAAPRPDPGRSTHFWIRTEPSGVLVVYGQKVLGSTPLQVDLPVAAPSKLGVRLSSPRFQPWVEEVEVSPSADFRILASLKSR